jgi:hypothetical protein
MKVPDILIEFEKPDKIPREFKFVIISIPLIVGFYFFLLYPGLKRIYIEEKNFWNWRTYLYCLILLYPFIGLQGYMLSRKYGWFILSHYLLTSTIIISIAGLYSLSEGDITFKKLLVAFGIIFLNAVSLFIIFKKSILQIFNITKDNKLLFILIIIVFTIINAVIWALS